MIFVTFAHNKYGNNLTTTQNMANFNDYNFAGKKAIVRVDFNVPLNEEGKITDDTRIRGALPTLKKILADGGSLVVMSHMGKPKGKVNPKLSLSQIVDAVATALGTEVSLPPTAPRQPTPQLPSSPARCSCLRTCVSIPRRKASPWASIRKIPAMTQLRKR